MKKNKLPVERKKPGCNGQYYVTIRNRKEWLKLLDILKERQYSGFDNVSRRTRPTFPPALVVDVKTKNFFLTSVTCLACAASCGHRAISLETFCELFNEREASPL